MNSRERNATSFNKHLTRRNGGEYFEVSTADSPG